MEPLTLSRDQPSLVYCINRTDLTQMSNGQEVSISLHMKTSVGEQGLSNLAETL